MWQLNPCARMTHDRNSQSCLSFRIHQKLGGWVALLPYWLPLPKA